MCSTLEQNPRPDQPPEVRADIPKRLPFAHLNLRRNPFGEIDLSQRALLAVADVDRFVRRLRRTGYAVQFTGERGRGKTTHLIAIGRHFPHAAYVHIEEDRRPRIPRGRLLLIDEVQRLPRKRRRRVFRRPVALALGTHLDVSPELADAGFEVETVALSGTLRAQRLREMLNRRIDWARRSPGEVPVIALRTAETMIHRFGDNIRAIEWHLYEVFQSLAEIRHV